MLRGSKWLVSCIPNCSLTEMSVWIGLMKPKGVELFVNRKYQAYSSLSVLSFAPSLSVKEREREREREKQDRSSSVGRF